MDVEDDSLPVVLRWESVRSEVRCLAEVFDWQLYHVCFSVVHALHIEVFECLLIIEDIVSLRRLLFFGVDAERSVHHGISSHGVHLALAGGEEEVRVLVKVLGGFELIVLW